MGKAAVSAFESALSEVGGAFKKAFKGEQILHSNAAIKATMNNAFGAGELGYRVFKNGDNIKDAAMATFGKFDKAGEAVLNAAGKQQLNYGKIAGSYLGAAAAVRVATGGGVTKDKNGNSNLIGVPFI